MYRDYLAKTAASQQTRVKVATLISASLLLVGSLTLGFERWLRAPAPLERGQAAARLLFPLAVPEKPGLQRPPPESGLMGEGDLSFGEFMGYLQDGAKDPAVKPIAEQVVKAFRQEPALKEVYRKYKEGSARGENPSAFKFIDELRAKTEFRKLAAQFAGAPVTAALMALSQRPEAATQADAGPQTGGGERARPGGRVGLDGAPPTFDQARAGILDAMRPGAQAGPPPSGPRSFDAAGGGEAAPAGVAVGMQAGPPGPGGAWALQDKPAAAGAQRADQVSGVRDAGKPNLLKDVKELPSKDRVAKLLELYPFLGKYFTRAELEKLASDMDAYGLWGACFANQWFARCTAACKEGFDAGGRRVCVPKPGWEACMDAFADAGRCISLCKSQAPCQVPPKQWSAYCADPRVQPPPAECTSRNSSTQAPGRPGEKEKPPLYTSQCVEDPYGKCCFNSTGQEIWAWPAGKRVCDAPGLPVVGKCQEGNGACCWNEDTGDILYTNVPDQNPPRAPVACRQPGGQCDSKSGLPVCCDKNGDQMCCRKAKDKTPIEGFESACAPPPTDRPTAPPPSPVLGPFLDVPSPGAVGGWSSGADAQ